MDFQEQSHHHLEEEKSFFFLKKKCINDFMFVLNKHAGCF